MVRTQTMGKVARVITVLHVIDTGGPGGAETVFLNTVAGIDARRFRSIAVVSRDGWLAEQLRARGIEPTILHASGSFNVSYLRAILSLIHKYDVDIVAAHLYGSAVYCSLAGLLARRPVISVLHGQSDISGKGRFSGLKKLLVRSGSTKAVFVSTRLRDELKRALSLADSSCVVIPNGIDVEKYSSLPDQSVREQLGISRDHILVGAIGNIRKPKSYDVLLRAARKLVDLSPRYRFAIAGEGSGDLLDKLLALRAELGLTDKVHFLGLRADVPLLLRNFDVYALSSTTEGFSIACVEAMASGVPVVATRSGGPEEILDDGKTGLLVPTNDPLALADAIERVATDAPLATLLRQQSRLVARERYALSSMLRAYEELFVELHA